MINWPKNTIQVRPSSIYRKSQHWEVKAGDPDYKVTHGYTANSRTIWYLKLKSKNKNNKQTKNKLYYHTWIKVQGLLKVTWLEGEEPELGSRSRAVGCPQVFLLSYPISCQCRPSLGLRLPFSAGQTDVHGDNWAMILSTVTCLRTLTQFFSLFPEGDWLHPLQRQHTFHDTCDWTATTREHPAHLSEQQCAHQAHRRYEILGKDLLYSESPRGPTHHLS